MAKVSRLRDKEGKFLESSPYSKKQLAIRLLKQDEKKLREQAEKEGVTPTELARKAIAEWLNQQEKSA